MFRIHIRPPEPADDAAVQPWLPEAVAAVQGRDAAPAPVPTLTAARALWDTTLAPGLVRLALLPDGTPAGVARIRHGTGSTLVVDALAIRRDARNLGYGQEFVFALEREFGATHSFAGVPRANGLAVYFWLRAGYRPVYPARGDEPLALDARLWMRRELTDPT